MWNRGATSKAKIENDKPRTTGAILPNDSPGLYAVHQPSPAQQQQQQQQMVAAAVPNGNFNGIEIVAQSAGMTPQRQQQMLQMMQRQMMLQQQQQQQQQWAQQYVQQLQNMHSAQIRQMTPQMQAQIQQMARMGQINGQLGNMMMNDNVNVNANNMQAIVAMQIQQQQQAQAQAQAQQAHAEAQAQHQGQGPQQAHTTLQVQMQAHTRLIYNRLMGAAVAKFGGSENIPQDTVDKIKEQSYAQAQQSVRELLQPRAQQEQQAAMRRA
ncbi:uncharacterized protein T069G_10455 [Trichoderma breve]|uniref:Uncharacterized protein n=1 Tax=Trichoderma breve TaxID=2034170 RepID=A0A9W9B3M6_9HYPO|nr:uncharacterized protein T069G_10455 [Trichoderma breve]KAJ4854897.1 hypothetical protein T069G_10455 [Trichoderma breve]